MAFCFFSVSDGVATSVIFLVADVFVVVVDDGQLPTILAVLRGQPRYASYGFEFYGVNRWRVYTPLTAQANRSTKKIRAKAGRAVSHAVRQSLSNHSFRTDTLANTDKAKGVGVYLEQKGISYCSKLFLNKKGVQK